LEERVFRRLVLIDCREGKRGYRVEVPA